MSKKENERPDRGCHYDKAMSKMTMDMEKLNTGLELHLTNTEPEARRIGDNSFDLALVFPTFIKLLSSLFHIRSGSCNPGSSVASYDYTTL